MGARPTLSLWSWLLDFEDPRAFPPSWWTWNLRTGTSAENFGFVISLIIWFHWLLWLIGFPVSFSISPDSELQALRFAAVCVMLTSSSVQQIEIHRIGLRLKTRRSPILRVADEYQSPLFLSAETWIWWKPHIIASNVNGFPKNRHIVPSSIFLITPPLSGFWLGKFTL